MILSACGSSSNNNGGTKDAGHDSATGDSSIGMDSTSPTDSGGGDTTMTNDTAPPPGDTSPPPGDTSPPGDASDAGDANPGPCNFAVVVTGLVTNDTTATALPSPISILNGCVDDMSQADYPPAFF